MIIETGYLHRTRRKNKVQKWIDIWLLFSWEFTRFRSGALVVVVSVCHKSRTRQAAIINRDQRPNNRRKIFCRSCWCIYRGQWCSCVDVCWFLDSHGIQLPCLAGSCFFLMLIFFSIPLPTKIFRVFWWWSIYWSFLPIGILAWISSTTLLYSFNAISLASSRSLGICFFSWAMIPLTWSCARAK